MGVDSEIMALLPWAAMLVLTISDIMLSATHIIKGHQARRHALQIVGLLCLGAGWSLVIISAGPAPVVARAAMLSYIRLCVALGALLLLGANAIEALLAVRRYQAQR